MLIGRIANDSTIVFHTRFGDYRANHKDKPVSINEVYHFRPFGPKPDSTTKFVEPGARLQPYKRIQVLDSTGQVLHTLTALAHYFMWQGKERELRNGLELLITTSEKLPGRLLNFALVNPRPMPPETYHDYVIKDGQFIGQFEEMYAKFADPWMQSRQPNRYARQAGILHLQNFQVTSVLECGCGLGYYAEWIYRQTGIVPKSVDLAPTAVAKARELFPHLDFEVADITTDLARYQHLDCVLFAEILWYILPQLPGLLAELKAKFAGKYLLVNQVFYKGSQKYGTEYFTNLNELIAYVPFELLARCEATTAHEGTIETSTLFKIG
ncbi:MAG: class I SAM-dependent methyltransferase [Bernardetiaceae bacterium]|nr:class I SAM-dependent methyltransferase [Bernardetiaceae bacterium]